ncbi:hypothetical protein [Clostridium novyi]|uniref:hypothetical protein n=1 Tax=Clostridium novyi TaxID=1542 RepID=UPI0004DA0384|nr:hypothetical protein [Clostridium novyi]KEH84579.1 hypothetical protein Z966_p0034 [Clostridium novyi A str. NCTC 538]
MYLFESKNLKEGLIEAVKKLKEYATKYSHILIGDILDDHIGDDVLSYINLIKCIGEEYTEIELDELGWCEEDNEENNIISSKEKVELNLDNSEISIDFHLDEFIKLVNEAYKAEIDENGTIILDRYAIIRIEKFFDFKDDTHNKKIETLNANIKIEDKNINIKVQERSKLYALKIYFDGNFDELNPIETVQELFIIFECEDSFFDKDNIIKLYNAYEYKLFLQENIRFNMIPKYNLKKLNDELVQMEEVEECISRSDYGFKIKDELFCDEVNELLLRFNSIGTVFDYNYVILEYFKILEYISDTVSRKQLIKDMVYKLNNHKPEEYDANYVMELEKIFTETQQKYMKARNKIKLVIEKCCDYEKIQEYIPDYIQLYIEETLSKNKNKYKKKYNKKKLVVYNIAKGITDTRHSIAHSRVNYSNNKYQCPIGQRDKMVKLLREICIQAINWYCNCDKNIRVYKKS